MRFKITLSYKGTNYCGWQVQKNGNSIQAELERALFKISGKTVHVCAAGRTDAKVHANGQVVHFDLDTSILPEKLPFAINAHLPCDIKVLSAKIVNDSFSARFDAKGKRYIYTIYNAPIQSALYYDFCMFEPTPLDVSLMQASAVNFIGTHDFASFCASGTSVKTTIRTITSLQIIQENNFIKIYIEGNGFLYNMVRIIAGTLIDVGKGKTSPCEIKNIILACRRCAAGKTAPPEGLILDEVFY